MPGLSAYDFGDSIRFGAATAAEDEKDLSIRRRVELENGSIVRNYRKKIRDIVIADGEPEEADIFGMMDENRIQDLPF